jgi:hypothetical protein
MDEFTQTAAERWFRRALRGLAPGMLARHRGERAADPQKSLGA